MVGDAMLAERRGHRPDDGELVRDLRGARKVFANLDAGRLGLDRLERPANVGLHIGLEIERLQMARAAVEPQQNARLRLRGLIAGRGARPEQVRQPKTQRAQATETEDIAAIDAIATTGECSRGHSMLPLPVSGSW